MALGHFYLTDRGNDLLARAQTGTQLTITRCSVGEGTWPTGVNYANITALAKPVKDMTIASATTEKGQAKITIQFTNLGIGRPFQWTECGLWASDPDQPGEEILYGTAYAADAPVPIDAALTEFRFNIFLKTASASNVTVVIDESLVYATKQDLQEALKDGLETTEGAQAKADAALAAAKAYADKQDKALMEAMDKKARIVIGKNKPETGPVLWFNTSRVPAPEPSGPETVLLTLTEADTPVAVLVDGNRHNVENITMDGMATEGKYHIELL